MRQLGIGSKRQLKREFKEGIISPLIVCWRDFLKQDTSDFALFCQFMITHKLWTEYNFTSGCMQVFNNEIFFNMGSADVLILRINRF